MSQRWSNLSVALGAVLGLAAAPVAHAQAPGTPRPAYSPYLNLTRPGGSLTNNYYGLVRPEQDFRRAIGSLATGYSSLSQEVNDAQLNAQAPARTFPSTGHGATFQNYSHYYPLKGPGRSPIGSGGRGITGAGLVGGGPLTSRGTPYGRTDVPQLPNIIGPVTR